MNEEKIIEVLSEHKKYSNAFREEIKVGLNTVVVKIEGVNRRLDISNGRTAKLETAINELEKADILMGEKIKTIKTGSQLISDRMWMLIVGVGIAVIVTIFNKFLIK